MLLEDKTLQTKHHLDVPKENRRYRVTLSVCTPKLASIVDVHRETWLCVRLLLVSNMFRPFRDPITTCFELVCQSFILVRLLIKNNATSLLLLEILSRVAHTKGQRAQVVYSCVL